MPRQCRVAFRQVRSAWTVRALFGSLANRLARPRFEGDSPRCLREVESAPIRFFLAVAERVRFELTNPVRGLRFSRPVQSTALPPLRVNRISQLQYSIRVPNCFPKPCVDGHLACEAVRPVLGRQALQS